MYGSGLRIDSNESGFTHSLSNNDLLSVQHKEPFIVVVIIGIIGIMEGLVLLFVMQTSWISFTTASTNSTSSIWSFLKALPALKKYFLISNTIIFLLNGINFVRLLLPLQYDDDLCTLMLKITGPTSYNISMVSVYMYMWARQYFLHSSPVLESVLPRWLPVLSKISFLLTVFSFCAPLVMLWMEGYVLAVYVDGACYDEASSRIMFPALMMISTVIAQSSYVILFYTTLKAYQKANCQAAGTKTNYKRLATRCLHFAALAVLTDCLAMAAIKLTGSHIPQVYVQLFPSIDIFLNILCMLFCFGSFSNTLKKFASMMSCNRIVWDQQELTDEKQRTRKKGSQNTQKVEV